MIPFIFGAAAVGTAAYGLFKGAEGASDILSAKERGESTQAKYQTSLACLDRDKERTNEMIEEYGQLKLWIASITVRRFVDFIERTGRKASQSEQEFLEDLDISPQQISQYRAVAINAESTLNGVVMAGAAAGAAYSGAMGLATSVGVASTGAAISGLSGAAATNATLAWLGGGALSAGGGGMALGSLVLGGITVGPALAIGGFVLAGQGEEALTKIRKYEAEVNVAVEKIQVLHDMLRQVRNRLLELEELLQELDYRSQKLLDELEACTFNPQQDAELFQKVALLIKALVEIMKVPLLGTSGELNPAIEKVVNHYSSSFSDTKVDILEDDMCIISG